MCQYRVCVFKHLANVLSTWRDGVSHIIPVVCDVVFQELYKLFGFRESAPGTGGLGACAFIFLGVFRYIFWVHFLYRHDLYVVIRAFHYAPIVVLPE